MTNTPFPGREWLERRAADCREALAEAGRTIRVLEAQSNRALDDADIRTAEQRARAERAEEALRIAGGKPGKPVAWHGPAIAAQVVSDDRWTDLRVLAGLDRIATTVFGRIGEAGDAAIVGLQSRTASLGLREVRVELWLGLAPGGMLDQLYATLGELIHERDAKRQAAAAVRRVAGSAT